MIRIPVGVKFIFLIAMYAGWGAAIISWSIQAMHENAFVTLGMQSSLGVILVPNVLSFGATAWILRHYWASLRLSQIVGAALFVAPATVILAMLVVLIGSPFFGKSDIVTNLWFRVSMIVPGMAAAQLLRLTSARQRGSAIG